MILNINSLFSEFIDRFLTIIQDEVEQNKATLVSGFLRAKILTTMDGVLSSDQDFLPLSAVVKSGLVNKEGKIAEPEEPQAKSILFFFDRERTLAQLLKLGLDQTQYSEIQQLILVTACQEATNQIISGSMKVFVTNLQSISNNEQQEQIRKLITDLATITLSRMIGALKFNGNSTSLSGDSIILLNRQRILFSEISRSEPGLMIPDEELTNPSNPEPALLSLSQRIMLLDELLPCLTLDLTLLSYDEVVEHQTKLNLLQLYCSILSMTKNDSWQVKAQWLYPGNTIQVGVDKVSLPNSISEIMDIITIELAKKHKACYQDALKKIQLIASHYEWDWYTWTRNQLPIISAQSA
jgi:hypothetical protein